MNIIIIVSRSTLWEWIDPYTLSPFLSRCSESGSITEVLPFPWANLSLLCWLCDILSWLCWSCAILSWLCWFCDILSWLCWLWDILSWLCWLCDILSWLCWLCDILSWLCWFWVVLSLSRPLLRWYWGVLSGSDSLLRWFRGPLSDSDVPFRPTRGVLGGGVGWSNLLSSIGTDLSALLPERSFCLLTLLCRGVRSGGVGWTTALFCLLEWVLTLSNSESKTCFCARHLRMFPLLSLAVPLLSLAGPLALLTVLASESDSRVPLEAALSASKNNQHECL